MMRFLAINTALSYVEVSAVNGERTAYLFDAEQRKASESMLSLIDKVLTDTSLKLEDADYIACCIGPGSFTGIRIGVTTARAFAHSLNKDIVPFTSHDVLAYNYMCQNDKGETASKSETADKSKTACKNGIELNNGVICASDAGNGFVYISEYSISERGETAASEILCLKKDDVAKFVAERRGKAVVCEPTVAHLFESFSIAAPSSAALCGAVKNAFKANGAREFSQIEPLYIRQPQAIKDLKP